MKLFSFKIEGFRRVYENTVYFEDATFLIGKNNTGKSSILKALELFFSENKPKRDDFLIYDHNEELCLDQIRLTATFTDLPSNIDKWSGFKGRIVKIENKKGKKVRAIIYRKTFKLDGKDKHEMQVYKRSRKSLFKDAKTLQDIMDKGIPEEEIRKYLPDFTPRQQLTTKTIKPQLRNIDDLWEISKDQVEWFNNPGGIPGNILIKLPRFLLIPAEDNQDEITGSSGTLNKTMKELFLTVRDKSQNYKKAQRYLNLLAEELDPNDESLEFGKMMKEVNNSLKSVFPESALHVETSLKDPDKSIAPNFKVSMSSNVKTTTDRQGMGTIRSAVFSLLRYREEFVEKTKEKKGGYVRQLIIGFEEPEIYLHPNAANNMRDEIYNLATSTNSKIISTTHSPYMIDLSKSLDKQTYPKQILNLIDLKPVKGEVTTSTSHSKAFNITDAYLKLKNEEKDYLKMILKMDDYISRVFFASKIVIIEGDTEDIVLRETIKRMPQNVRKSVLSNYQIIKARGKASIIALTKYLRSMGLDPIVIHDKDSKSGATKFNNPILKACSSPSKRFMLKNNIEDVLGYAEPKDNKPFKAFEHIKKNWDLDLGWNGVEDNWRKICEMIFKDAFKPYLISGIVQSVQAEKIDS